MSLRLLRSALLRRKGRVALGVLAILLGVALATSLLGLLTVSGERIARELRGYGANILVTPRSGERELEVAGVSLGPRAGGALLDEEALHKLKTTIFWKNNILGLAPFLSLVAQGEGGPVVVSGTWFDHPIPLPQGGPWAAGAPTLFPGWRIEGQTPRDGDREGALVGASLARRLNLQPDDRFSLSYQGRRRELAVRGLLHSGGLEEDQVLVDLPVAQELAGVERGADRVLVSALTIPKEKLPPEIRYKDPKDMTPEEYEKWYCSPVIEAIVTQIDEVTPGGTARPIRQVSEAEARFLLKTELLGVLMTAVALALSALVVLSAMTALVLERRGEVGLMKALGAEEGQIVFLFALEAGAMGLLGGVGGYLLGSALGYLLGPYLWGTPLPLMPSLLPLSLALALGVSFLGSAWPIWQAVKTEPVTLLQEAG